MLGTLSLSARRQTSTLSSGVSGSASALSRKGAEALGYETTLIDVFYELGLRMVSLTWNRRNPFADGAAEPDGGGPPSKLWPRARRPGIVGLGIVLDLVHSSEAQIPGTRSSEATCSRARAMRPAGRSYPRRATSRMTSYGHSRSATGYSG